MDNYTNNMTDPLMVPEPGQTQAVQPDPAAKEKEERERAGHFMRLALPCAIYTLVFVFCMYKNAGAVTTPVWILSLIALIVYFIKSAGKSLKKGSIFLAVIMMLISVSCFYTANPFTLFMNYAVELMLTLTLVLHNYADDSKWDLGKLLCEMFAAPFASLSKIYTPFVDGAAFFGKKGTAKKGVTQKILLGVLCSVPVLALLGMLLASADLVFMDILDRTFREIDVSNTFLFILMLVFGFFSAYCGIRYMSADGAKIVYEDQKKADPVTPTTVIVLISVLYLAFSAVQILYLFIGKFSLPEGMTYATYARQGFFQLLLVSVLNLIAILFVKKYVRRTTLLDVFLVIICICTGIMIASSALRMIMYIRAYSLTYDRVAVLVTLLTLSVLLAGVIIYVIFERFPLMKFTVVALCVLYTAFAFVKTDNVIVKYNLKYPATESGSDILYISSLSADAAPAILEYIKEQQAQGTDMTTTGWYELYYTNNGLNGKFVGIRKYNMSKQAANDMLPTPR